MSDRESRKSYRPREVVEVTGLSISTVNRMLKDGRLPSVRLGGCVLVPAAELDRLLAGATAGQVA